MTQAPLTDTIFALASAPGRAGVAVVRVSGPEAAQAAVLMHPARLPPPRTAQTRRIHDPVSNQSVDQALVLSLPGPHNFTGEDIVELHLHGGAAIVRRVSQLLYEVCNFRLAEPGEFTRRGLLHGRFDLTAAEAVNDLVNAETEAQRAQALYQLEGGLAKIYDGWHERLKGALAHIEAAIDFIEEEGVPKTLIADRQADVGVLINAITHHLNDNRRGEILRDGLMISILGAPNAGKSSLLNTLARRDAAIVSATAGTTRDIVEVRLDLGGYPVILADTAGLRETADAVEHEGIRRALKRAEESDLKILLFDGGNWPKRDRATEKLMDANAITVISKSDLVQGAINDSSFSALSVTTGDGITAFLERLTALVAERLASRGGPSLTRERHRQALGDCLSHLQKAQNAKAPELFAEDLRLAMRALGRLTGRVDVEDLLDMIFRDFCIGK